MVCGPVCGGRGLVDGVELKFHLLQSQKVRPEVLFIYRSSFVPESIEGGFLKSN